MIARTLTLACWLATSLALAADPPLKLDGLAVRANLQYRPEYKSCVMDLAMPKENGGRPRPLIVVIHGGGWLEGDKSSFSTFERLTPGNIFEFAARGFVAVTINYRLSGEAPYPAPLDDCRAAIAWLRSRADEYHLDPDRVGVWGNSAGGHLALMLAMADLETAPVQAAVSDSGPIDLVYGHEHNQLVGVVEKLLGGPPVGQRLATYRQASPSTYFERAARLPPLMLIYGGRDEQVDVRTADEFVAALSRGGAADLTYYRLADAGHCPHSLVRVPYLRAVVQDFFVRVLKP